ncbi:MAG: hypothetical protein H7A33_02475 [Deltaproteobacteria bacterium]|nr:hypothetical protein [Deltaproteobacteria bacterium]
MKSRYLFLTLLFLLPAAVGFSKGRPTPDGITPKTSTGDFDSCRPNQVIAKVDILDIGDSVDDCFSDTISGISNDFTITSWVLQDMEKVMEGTAGIYFPSYNLYSAEETKTVGISLNHAGGATTSSVEVNGLKVRLKMTIPSPHEGVEVEPGTMTWYLWEKGDTKKKIHSFKCDESAYDLESITSPAFNMEFRYCSYNTISIVTEGNCNFHYYGAELIKQ